MKMKKRGDRKGCSAFLHATLMSLAKHNHIIRRIPSGEVGN